MISVLKSAKSLSCYWAETMLSWNSNGRKGKKSIYIISILTPGHIEAVFVPWTVLPSEGLCPLQRCLLVQQNTEESLELLDSFSGMESVGDCVSLLLTFLSEPQVLITVAAFRDPNHTFITDLLAEQVHTGNRKQGCTRGTVTCLWHWQVADIQATALSNKLEGVISWEPLSASGNPQFLRFSEQEFASKLWWINDELISRSIYHTLEIILLWIFPLLKQTLHFDSVTFSTTISPLPSPVIHHRSTSQPSPEELSDVSPWLKLMG